MPYKHSKRSTISPPRFIEENPQLPHPEPKSLDEANANIGYLSYEKAQGRISIDSSDSLIADQRTMANRRSFDKDIATVAKSLSLIQLAANRQLKRIPEPTWAYAQVDRSQGRSR
jgi:hypothetical protein